MQSPRPRQHAAGRVLVAGVAAAFSLVGCGTTTAPQPGETSRAAAPVRPVTDQPVEADGALQCPESVESAAVDTPARVPQKPQGLDATGRLLPDRDPTSVVVCGYPVVDVVNPISPPFRLSRRTVASDGQRAALVEALTWSPRDAGAQRVCTLIAGNETAYLVGSVYDEAIVWVSAVADANACSTSTNGDFRSGPGPAAVLDQMFGPATPPAADVVACNPDSWGRLGDDRSLAPAGDPTVTVCRDAADGTVRETPLDTAQSAEVTAELRSMPTQQTSQTCQGPTTPHDGRFTLVLTYAAGPAVRIDVDPLCAPAVLGSDLQSADAGRLVELVQRWSPPIPGPDPNISVTSSS
jgi:hypothetical protein